MISNSFFKTWDAIAEYVTSTVGYEYLTNPTSWIDAFKELVGDARYVGDNTFYQPNPTGNWVNVGKPVAPAIDTGVKMPPAVTNIITDATTGAAVIGETAVAVEQTGIFIELSVAGYFATALAGLGVGVLSYELFPDFYRNISNYVFGTNLTQAETEPFLRKKIKTVLSVDSNDGKPITYIPEYLVKRTYNYIAQHLNVTGGENTFPSAVVNPTNGSITSGSSQTMPYLKENYLSKKAFQDVVNGAVQILNARGYANMRAVDITELYNELQSSYDLSDMDLITYNIGSDWRVWNNNFEATSETGNVMTSISVNCYRLTQAQKSETYILKRARDFAPNTKGYIGKISPTIYPIEPAVSGSYLIHSVIGYDPTTDIDTTANGHASYAHNDTIEEGNGLNRYVGYYPVSNTPQTPVDIFLQDPLRCKNIRYSNPVDQEDVEPDSYFKDKVFIKGKTPKSGVDFDNRYPERIVNKKQIAQPNINGEPNLQGQIPGTAPIGKTVTDKVIYHGINNDDDDSYKEDQDDNVTGKDTPEHVTPDDVNDSIEETIDNYNDSEVDPRSAPEPSPVPLPDYPVNPPQDPGGDSGDTPDPSVMPGVTASGMVSVYNPTKEQLKNFSAWLWTDSIIENLKKIMANPVDAIIGLHIMYATPVTGSPENIICGYLDSGVPSKVVTQQYIDVDCGHVTVPEYYGNALDYEPYTQVHIYLPFIGIQALKANDVLGKDLYVKYGVDVLTGTVLAVLTTKSGDSDISCYQFAGNCAVQIPLTGGSYAEVIKGIASMAVGVAGSVVTGNPLPAIGGVVAGAMGSSLDVSRSGALGANAGVMGVRKPYLIITRRKAYEASNYNQFYGCPANKTVKLSSCRGYTRVKSVHIDSIPIATDNEKTEIETLLKQGVIIR